ncbi:MAG TPA: uroporphyrinogen-III synthase [Candidatus Agrococcus pullicola]|uniref:Uroporphyrinogen-III synthase n=1 Tax=Candidatus Agrococcus pullicola TaxID=2838429 RepID=A0A9D1YWA5_9MICO|nr:uroporphyrinogen-III synthase [Candidatus Agrococcus pullicola]
MMKVLVPRKPDEAGEWVDALSAHQLEAVTVPLTVIVPSEQPVVLPEDVDWLIVTSRNTVPLLPEIPEHVRVAAVGDGTSLRLRELGIHVDFVPVERSAAGLVAEWPGEAGELVFIPQSALARPQLADGLRAAGARVETFAAYRPEPSIHDAAAFEHADVDAVLVTSGSMATQLERLGAVHERLRQAPIIAIGHPTARDCEALGLTVAAIAPAPTPQAMAETAAAVLRGDD